MRRRNVGNPDQRFRQLFDGLISWITIDYIVKLLGIDHVGFVQILMVGGGIEGWSDALKLLNVTLELVDAGYTKKNSTTLGR